jgi:hypothetical protein
MEKIGQIPPARPFFAANDEHDTGFKSDRPAALVLRFPGASRCVVNFGFWHFYPIFNKNRMFTQPVQALGHDWSASTRLLRQTLESMGHQVATLDMKPLKWFDRVFFIDYPHFYPGRGGLQGRRFFHALLRARHPDINLILTEPAIVRPGSYDPKVHKPFRRVLTYKKDLCAIDPSKYVLYQPTAPSGPVMEPPPFERRKLCCMIQTYMVSDKPNELFSERVRAVRWFEANAPRDFDLFGADWDRLLLPGRLSALNLGMRFLWRAPVLKMLRFRRFPSFVGPTGLDIKRTLMDYRFSFSYENAVEKDWISEKLFDRFHAGCVPVYYGAPNVTDYVPADTFIDKRQFSYDELYRRISTMTEREYNGYLAAARDYLRSPACRPFTPEGYVETFISHFT